MSKRAGLPTTKLAQSTAQYYFVLQSLHKVLPSTTSYYKAHTKYFPVPLRTIQPCTKYFPVLLRTTKLAQSTSQYYFVLQSLHKVLPSTTSICYHGCRYARRCSLQFSNSAETSSSKIKLKPHYMPSLFFHVFAIFVCHLTSGHLSSSHLALLHLSSFHVRADALRERCG